MAYLKLAQVTAINAICKEIRQERINMIVHLKKDRAHDDALINHELGFEAALQIAAARQGHRVEARELLVNAAALLIAEIERIDRL